MVFSAGHGRRRCKAASRLMRSMLPATCWRSLLADGLDMLLIASIKNARFVAALHRAMEPTIAASGKRTWHGAFREDCRLVVQQSSAAEK